jgi:hypothetical protein
MKQLLAFVVLNMLCITLAYTQSFTLKGVVTDTLNKQNLANATIAVLNKKDSVLLKFTRSDKDGRFELNKLPGGKHLIMITYPTYADYFEEINLTDNPIIDRGTVKMTLLSKLLESVTVRSKIAAIRLKGDTVEYKADSFKVSAGASVEEMLRKLPGLQVDKDGNITAQGTKVEKVLVDGEEFFGDDPTMATKNLQAEAIDKVQVFDKKSDQAAFTGIDDGKSQKTLNLTLKEDRKKGYFGKVELKGGTGNRWSNTVMANAFKGKRKLSGYGIMSSTGTTGLNWQDRDKYGDGSGMEFNADEGYFFIENSGDEFDNGGGSFGGEGIPKSWSAGVNYGNKFDKDQQTVNGSYRYNKLINEGSGSTFTQSVLPTGVLYNKENRSIYNNRERHSANGTYEWNIDSFTNIKVVARGYKGTQKNNSLTTSALRDSSGNIVNTSERITFGDGDNSSFNSNFILRRRFKKPGRTLSLSFDEQYKNTDNQGWVISSARYFDKAGALLRKDTIDQQKINDNTVTGYNTRLAYTEPFFKNTFLELSYALRITQSESEKISYTKNNSGKYEVLDPLYSNHYDYNIATNTGGVMLRYNTKKYTLAGGGDIGKSAFTQTDLMKDTTRKYSFTNFFPRANLQYKFNTNSRVSFNYNGNTRQPTIEQIQPVRDNSNILNVAIGNPGLKQEFRHNFNLSYNFYKVLTQRGLYVYSNFTTVSNAITTNEFTATTGDTVGKRTYQFINVNGNYNGYASGGYNFKSTKLDISFSFGLNANFSHNNNVINNIKNASDNNSYGINFSVYRYKENKYNIQYYSSFNYNNTISSVKSNFKTNYYTHNHNLRMNVTLLKKWEFNSNVSASFRQQLTANDQNNNVVLWNGYLGRKLLKNDAAMLRIEANDILNQNKGYSRYTNNNILTERTYETLSRYFLLAFVWNFTKTPGGAPAPAMR